MLLVPMPGWHYVSRLLPEQLISLRKEFDGKVWWGVHKTLTRIAQPQAKEYLTSKAEGDIIVTKGLVLRYACLTKAKISNFLNIHTLSEKESRGAGL